MGLLVIGIMLDGSLPRIGVAPPFEAVAFGTATDHLDASVVAKLELDGVGRGEE